MNCPKCNSIINQGENLCKVCNYSFNQNASQNPINTNYSQDYVNDELYKEDMLINAYMGRKAYKFKNGGFSWCTLLFTTYYSLYRKMWLFSLILWLSSVAVTNLVGNLKSLDFIINLIIQIIAACIFKAQYLKHATKKVRKIKEKNPNKTHEELLIICKNKGGTSIAAILAIIGIIFIETGIDLLIN